MRWVHLFCIGAAVLLSACGIGAQFPEFSAKQYRLEGVRRLPGTDVTGPAVFYRDGERLRYEGLTENNGVATVIYDPTRNASYLLDSADSRRRVFAGPAPERTATQITEAEAPQPLEVAWAALGSQNVRGFGRCRIAGERGNLWRPREPIAPDVARTACITPDGIVLQLTENDTVLFEAMSLERGPQAASLFVIPETYRIIGEAELAQAENEAIETSAAGAGTPQTRTPR
jgi:hypothetical protein